ncbi:ribokinase [Deinococcus malanensis]|uniref:ribokinase n=1 Tax=Deinococcus malanensis TaxID=1706855 RepID=UPI00363A31DF
MSVLVVGSINADITVRAERIPGPGETVLGQGARLSPGGKGANQAVAAALAGAAVRMVGAVGRDAFRDVALAGLQRSGVDLSDLQILDAPTGLALITVDPAAENAITVASGANTLLSPAHLPERLDGFTHLLLQQELGPEVTLAAARHAQASGLRVLLNAAPARSPDPELLQHVHHLIVNEHELAEFSGGSLTVEASALEAAARNLLTCGPDTATVTLGALGHLTVTSGQTLRFMAHPVTPVDTTGAGDTFVGCWQPGWTRAKPYTRHCRLRGWQPV